jgi:oligo-1,6-glucosidase
MAVQGIEHYKGQEGNHAVLREFRRDVLAHYDCFTVGETVMVDLDEAKLLCDKSRQELDMLFYFEHLEVDRRISRFIPKKFRAKKLLEVLSKWQRGLEWNAVYLENHDQSRIVSHFGPGDSNAEYRKRAAKLFALLELTLRGTVFIYQGQEIGMTNFDFKNIDELDDVESRNLDKLMKKMHIPGWLRWKWIKASSRDNARTPMQWNTEENAGFSGGKPWLGVNGNYKKINYEDQKNDPGSVLNFYKTLIRLRRERECFKAGVVIPIYADNCLMIYRRRLGEEMYTAVFNFSSRKIQAPKKVSDFLSGRPLVSNTGRAELEKILLPWEAVLFTGSLLENSGK